MKDLSFMKKKAIILHLMCHCCPPVVISCNCTSVKVKQNKMETNIHWFCFSVRWKEHVLFCTAILLLSAGANYLHSFCNDAFRFSPAHREAVMHKEIVLHITVHWRRVTVLYISFPLIIEKCLFLFHIFFVILSCGAALKCCRSLIPNV